VKHNKNTLKSLQCQAKNRGSLGSVHSGEMYRKGENVARNSTEAANLYRPMADNSICRTAGYLLGLMYLKGEGVPKNYSKAFKRFSQASIGGHRAAQECLGRMYENGLGFPKNWTRPLGGLERQPSRRGILDSLGTGTGL
jgi:TPR repeat protein